jgi:hypothetical protein
MTKVMRRVDREPGFDRLLDFGERLCRASLKPEHDGRSGTPARRLRRRRVWAAGCLLVCRANRRVCFWADSGVVTEMPDGPRYGDLLLVPAGGMALRRMSAAARETLPA